MSEIATAHAQAVEALDEAAKSLKRGQNTNRRALQLIRQAQMNIVGIPVEITETQSPEEGTANGITHSRADQ